MPDSFKSHLQLIMNYTGSVVRKKHLNFKRCILSRSQHTTPHLNDLIRKFSHAMNFCAEIIRPCNTKNNKGMWQESNL